MSLERSRRVAAFVLSAGLLAGCGSSGGDVVPPVSTSTSSASASETQGSSTPTQAPSSTASEKPISSITAEPSTPSAPTTLPSEVFSGDPAIKRGLQQAPKGETVTLVNPLIGTVTRTPTLGGEGYVATIWTVKRPGNNDVAALVPNAECIFNALKAANELGSPSFIPGRWVVDRRIGQLTADVILPYSLFNPKPTIHLSFVTVNNKKLPC